MGYTENKTSLQQLSTVQIGEVLTKWQFFDNNNSKMIVITKWQSNLDLQYLSFTGLKILNALKSQSSKVQKSTDLQNYCNNITILFVERLRDIYIFCYICTKVTVSCTSCWSASLLLTAKPLIPGTRAAAPGEAEAASGEVKVVPGPMTEAPQIKLRERLRLEPQPSPQKSKKRPEPEPCCVRRSWRGFRGCSRANRGRRRLQGHT